MAASLTSSLSTTSTFSSASLRRASLLPHHQQPNSLSLARPTSFPSIRAQSSSSEKGGEESKVEKAGKEINEITMDTLKGESEKVNEGLAEMHEEAVEKIGEDTTKAVDTAKVAKKEIQDVAEDVAEKTTEKVGKIWDAATGKS